MDDYTLGKAQADTKIVTMDMVRVHMNEELQARAIEIQEELSKQLEKLSNQEKEALKTERSNDGNPCTYRR